jgi:predicted metal-dependent hydrolase
MLVTQDQLPVRLSKRAKRMSIMVRHDGRWEIVIPHKKIPSQKTIQRFVAKHQDWIQKNVQKAQSRPERTHLAHQGIPRTLIESQTRIILHEHIDEICATRSFLYRRVKTANYKAQWGSCSKTKNLSFHYKLSLLPKHLSHYIVAHELSHTVHFNHSKDFWELVRSLCPQANAYRKELKQYVL